MRLFFNARIIHDCIILFIVNRLSAFGPHTVICNIRKPNVSNCKLYVYLCVCTFRLVTMIINLKTIIFECSNVYFLPQIITFSAKTTELPKI